MAKTERMLKMLPDYKPIINAYKRQNETLDECYSYLSPATSVNINISSIIDKIITNAGRFCERYASDVLFDLNYINYIIKNYNPNQPEEYIICFGIRRDGVDGNSFLESRIKNDFHNNPWRISEYYRKILAVHIFFDEENSELHCILKDITHSFTLSDFN